MTAAAAAKTAAAAKDVSKPHLWGRRAAVSTCMQGGSSVSKPYQRCEVTHGLRIIIRRCVVLVFIPDEGGHQIHSAALSGNASLMKEAIISTQRHSLRRVIYSGRVHVYTCSRSPRLWIISTCRPTDACAANTEPSAKPTSRGSWQSVRTCMQ